MLTAGEIDSISTCETMLHPQFIAAHFPKAGGHSYFSVNPVWHINLKSIPLAEIGIARREHPALDHP